MLLVPLEHLEMSTIGEDQLSFFHARAVVEDLV